MPDARGAVGESPRQGRDHHPDNQGANPADFDYAFNLTYGSGYFRDDDLLRDLRRLLDDETRRHIVP